MPKRPASKATQDEPEANGTTAARLRFAKFAGRPIRSVTLGEVTEDCTDRNGAAAADAPIMGVSKSDGIVPMQERLIGKDTARYKRLDPDWFAYNPMRLNIGSIARWKGKGSVLVSPDYIVFRCLDDGANAISPDYLDHFRSSMQWENFVTGSGDGGVRIRIYYKDLAKLRLGLPDPAEQQMIADCLTSLDEVIAAQVRKVEALKTHKKGLMQHLFPQEGHPPTLPRLRFPEFRDGPEWEEATLATAADLVSGIHLSPEQYGPEGDVPYFTGPSDFTDEIAGVPKWTAETQNVAVANDTLITVKGSGVGDRNAKLCVIIGALADGMSQFSTDSDTLGDAYEYLIGMFAAGSGKKAGEFYTPQRVSDILSAIVTLDSQEPKTGKRKRLENVFDFACGSGSLLLNVRHRMKEAGGSIGKVFGMEKNITTYNLARMNMLLHGVKDTEFEIYHGDTLTNDWDMLRETNPAKKPTFDAVVANPPFSYRWDPTEAVGEDMRFKNHGVAPRSAADFAFLLHGLHYLKEDGVMAIILPHGVLFRGGVEERIRTKLLKDGHIDTVIGLPANLFYSTGIPVCILVLKKCKKPDDVLIINASEEYTKGKRQNFLTDAHIEKIVKTYQDRPKKPIERYARRVTMEEIQKNDFNLNISRYVSTAEDEQEIDLAKVHGELVEIDKKLRDATATHNGFLKELGLPPLP